MTDDLMQRLEAYYDAAPRPHATTEEVGPFTVFVPTDRRLWPYYARPTLGSHGFAAEDVARVRARQRQLQVPEAIEWVHETTPTLLDAARTEGMQVAQCPLLVLRSPVPVPHSPVRVELLDAESTELSLVVAAVGAGFGDVDDFDAEDASAHAAAIRARTLVTVGAYDEQGDVLGGGSHAPRGSVTELLGIAVLPKARRRGVGAAITAALVADAHARGVETVFLSAQDDAVARVYERVGFVRVGTACIAQPPPATPEQPVARASRPDEGT